MDRLTVSPEWADLILSSDIPHGEGDVLVFDRLDIEAWHDQCIESPFPA